MSIPRTNHIGLPIALLICFSTNGILRAAQPSYTLIPVAIRDVLGASGDNTVITGWLQASGVSGLPAFKWTEAEGLTEIGILPGGQSPQAQALDSSIGGSVVVGFSTSTPGQQAFMWTQAAGMVGMGDLPGGSTVSHARAVSDDGSVIVGWGSTDTAREAFRWTQATGMVGLGQLPGAANPLSEAHDISANGNVIVGHSRVASGQEGFRWTQATGMVSIGELPGGSTVVNVTGVSDNGSVICGYDPSATSSSAGEAFRWTQATGMVGLGFLPGSDWSQASAISGDGSIIVGTSGVGFFTGRPFIWTQADGMRDLVDVMTTDFGLDLQGFTPLSAVGVTSLGQGLEGVTIIGTATNAVGARGYIAVLGTMPPCPGDANGDKTVNFSDITEVLGNWLNTCP